MTQSHEDETDTQLEPRATVEYGPDGVTVHGMSDRVDEDDAPVALEVFQQVTGQRLPDEPFGTHRASVHRFEHVVVVHYPFPADDSETGGIVATFDAADADRPMETLVEAAVAEAGDTQ